MKQGKIKNLFGIDLIKYSSEFLAHVKNIYILQVHPQMLKVTA